MALFGTYTQPCQCHNTSLFSSLPSLCVNESPYQGLSTLRSLSPARSWWLGFFHMHHDAYFLEDPPAALDDAVYDDYLLLAGQHHTAGQHLGVPSHRCRVRLGNPPFTIIVCIPAECKASHNIWSRLSKQTWHTLWIRHQLEDLPPILEEIEHIMGFNSIIDA